ncbi:hypothetical protein C8J56DRAFT_1062738 [Mycena floridula]|nr:hypothetical protein C8J56DRAFT_1062738 [Mycena floridula]
MFEDEMEFQSAIRYHEDTLMALDPPPRRRSAYPYFSREPYSRSNPVSAPAPVQALARVNLIGAFQQQGPPPFPRDDSVISAKGTPKSKNARPCRHCGSDLHWDNECHHSFKGMKTARARLASSNQRVSEEFDAQDEYDNLYYNLEFESDSSSGPAGFDLPLQITESVNTLRVLDSAPKGPEMAAPSKILENFSNSALHAKTSLYPDTDYSILDPNRDDLHIPYPSISAVIADTISDSTLLTEDEIPFTASEIVGDAAISVDESKSENVPLRAMSMPSELTACTRFIQKHSLNQSTQRYIAKRVRRSGFSVHGQLANGKSIVQLKKRLDRPPGCAFLGAKSTQAMASVNGLDDFI